MFISDNTSHANEVLQIIKHYYPVYEFVDSDTAVLFGKKFVSGKCVSMSADDDRALIARVRSNDAVAFDVLVKKYRERLFSVVYGMVGNREDAFDLVQDVFIKAYRGIKNFDGRSLFFTWLYRIAVNTAITKINKERFRKFFSICQTSHCESETQTNNTEYFIDDADAKKKILLRELKENLNEALQKLSNRHRAVMVLCEIEGLSSSDAAVVLKCSEGTVRSRLHYAKEHLKSLLGKYLK